MKKFHAMGLVALFCIAPWVAAEEPDHAIHEELRGVLREVQSAINSGQYDRMLPYLAPDWFAEQPGGVAEAAAGGAAEGGVRNGKWRMENSSRYQWFVKNYAAKAV